MAIEINRVVMIRYVDYQGKRSIGSGLRIGDQRVLTADHVAQGTHYTVVIDSGELKADVLCRSGDTGIDIAVLNVPDAKAVDWMDCALVEPDKVSTIRGCVAVGFPQFMRDASNKPRTAHVNGSIPTAEGVTAVVGQGLEHGHLSLKTENPHTTNRPLLPNGTMEGTPWAGMSGAVVVSGVDQILGVIRHHNGNQGIGTLGLTPLNAINLLPEPIRTELWTALAVNDPHTLPIVSDSGKLIEPLENLVALSAGTDLPLVRDLDPYLLGATPNNYASAGTSGAHDPYVPRTHNNVDDRLKELLKPGRMVLLIGPSKSGKTRTAFQSMLTQWPQAALLAPTPQGLASLARHPRLKNSTNPLIIWLDDLQRYLVGIPHPLTMTLLVSLMRIRPGLTMVVSTLRAEERARLYGVTGELNREVRQVLETAITLALDPTSTDLEEQAAARSAYPDEDLSVYGLAEQLAGAPALLRHYQDVRHDDPILHAVIQTAIDWERVGFPGPVLEEDLAALSIKTLSRDHPHIRSTAKKIDSAIVIACLPPQGSGRVATLATVVLPIHGRAYSPFSYLVAADDGQTGQIRRIPEAFWYEVLERITPSMARAIGSAAHQRNNVAVALRAFEMAAEVGDLDAMFSLGVVLTELKPPQRDKAYAWYEKAARAGHFDAMNNFGAMLAELNPPQRATACIWFEEAARAGNIEAMFNLGVQLVNLDPPQRATACIWFEKAARAGNIEAMFNLGVLLAECNPPQLEIACTWFEKAAQAGHPSAIINLEILQRTLKHPKPKLFPRLRNHSNRPVRPDS